MDKTRNPFSPGARITAESWAPHIETDQETLTAIGLPGAKVGEAIPGWLQPAGMVREANRSIVIDH
jgi:hypothetical protein